MNKIDILNTILAIPGAQWARHNKTNFIVVPTEDGTVKIAVGTALAADTQNRKAFNVEAAVAEYKAWEAEAALRAAERASKPKTVKGPNPEAQARRDELDAKIEALPSFTDYTATDVYNAIKDQIADSVTVMAVGQSAQRLVAKGIVTMTLDEKKKKHYTKA